MPRDSQGNFSLPSGTLVSVGQTIAPSQHNPAMEDIAQAMTGSLSRDGQGGMLDNLDGGGFRAVNFANGVQPTDLATVAQVTTGGGVPVGTVIDFAGSTPPTGWLICAGQTVSRATYDELFAVVGTTYGAPDASTFKLPDCRGRVIAGRDVDSGGFAGRLTTPNSQTVGATGGAQEVTLTEAQMPTHTHAVTGDTNSSGVHAHIYTIPNVDGVGVNGVGANGGSFSDSTETSGAHTHTINVSAGNAGSSEAHSNVQPVIVMPKIIKVSST